MPLEWDDLFFEQRAELVMSMFDLTDEEKADIQARWIEDTFEIDLHVYRGETQYTLDGRNSALSSLQKLCVDAIGQRLQTLGV